MQFCAPTLKKTSVLVGTDRKETTTTPAGYLDLNMKGKIIKTVTLPALDESYKFESYKVTPTLLQP